MCENPKWLYKTGKYKKLGVNANGIYQEGEKYEIGLYTKCGYCQECLNSKSNDWIVRNYFEAMKHEKICWITLTYAENPIILVKKDLQDFLKRFRYFLDKNGMEKIRFFAKGEYGTINARPHFHVILYGFNDENMKYLGINKKRNIVYHSDIIESMWGLGRTTIDNVGNKVIPYLVEYQSNKEIFARAYKVTMEKMKFLRNKERLKRMKKRARRNLQEQLKGIEKTLKKEKEKYYAIKEFNTWSIALGWESFYEDFLKNTEKYVFTCYFLENEYKIPSPWIKKLAMEGYANAIEELKNRMEYMEYLPINIMKGRAKNKRLRKESKEKQEWLTRKAEEEDF